MLILVSRYVINSEAAKRLYATMKKPTTGSEPKDLSREWHSDSLFENCPADFSFLRMQSTPPSGGDTLWCSGYELYDRLSPPFQKFFETLTATCAQPVFESACESGGYDVMSPRGSPLNVDYQFRPSHPVVRTHPVTGWKSLFAGVGLHVSRINEVTTYEDSMIRDYVLRLITRNHDCVARMHWTRGACAIWSNECTLHAATVSASMSLYFFSYLAKLIHANCSPIRTLWRELGPACGLPALGVCRTSTRRAKAEGKRSECPCFKPSQAHELKNLG